MTLQELNGIIARRDPLLANAVSQSPLQPYVCLTAGSKGDCRMSPTISPTTVTIICRKEDRAYTYDFLFSAVPFYKPLNNI